jgi:hypothetical protein
VTGAGTGTVLLLRWFWWRINAWSEVSAMAVARRCRCSSRSRLEWDGDKPRDFAYLMLVTVGLTTIAWLAVTWLTPPEPRTTLHAFYRRVRRAGRRMGADRRRGRPARRRQDRSASELLNAFLGLRAGLLRRCSASGSCCCASAAIGIGLLAALRARGICHRAQSRPRREARSASASGLPSSTFLTSEAAARRRRRLDRVRAAAAERPSPPARRVRRDHSGPTWSASAAATRLVDAGSGGPGCVRVDRPGPGAPGPVPGTAAGGLLLLNVDEGPLVVVAASVVEANRLILALAGHALDAPPRLTGGTQLTDRPDVRPRRLRRSPGCAAARPAVSDPSIPPRCPPGCCCGRHACPARIGAKSSLVIGSLNFFRRKRCSTSASMFGGIGVGELALEQADRVDVLLAAEDQLRLPSLAAVCFQTGITTVT